MADWLDAATFRSWAGAALAGFTASRAELDALNVFPVPDGDTGTNLFLTFQAAATSMEELFCADGYGQTTVTAAAETFSAAALLGARGNSGVIASQILRGFARIARSEESAATSDAASLAVALDEATRLAYEAVGEPKEGTILTVIRVAAEAAAARVAVAGPVTAESVARAALAGSREALEQTPLQLPVLAAAGVVDSGGAGCVVLLEALVEAISGIHEPLPPPLSQRHSQPNSQPLSQRHSQPLSQRHSQRRRGGATTSPMPVHYEGPASEVMFLLDAADERVPALRSRLGELGDSLVVVGGDGLWNVHVHVDDVGAAIEAGIEAGRPHRIKVTHLVDISNRESASSETGPQVESQTQRAGRALVAVAHGPGVAALLAEAGAATVAAQPDRRPSTQELLDAATATGAAEVVLLPSDRDTRSVADIAADLGRKRGIRMAVIPTRSIVQTLAAVAVHDPQRHFDDDVVAMGREAGATRYGAIAVAVRQSSTRAGSCEVGDVIGLVDGEIEVVGHSLAEVAGSVLGQLIRPSTELVTLVWGVDAPAELKAVVRGDLDAHRPDLETEEIEGGQPRWPLIVGTT